MDQQQKNKYCSIDNSTILLNVYVFLKKLDTMDDTSRTGTKILRFKNNFKTILHIFYNSICN